MLRMDFKDTEYKTDVCSGVYFGGWGALLDYYERTPGYELQHVTKININIGDSIYDGLFFQSNVSNFITFYIEKGTMALAVIVEGEDLESIKATIKNQFYEL